MTVVLHPWDLKNNSIVNVKKVKGLATPEFDDEASPKIYSDTKLAKNANLSDLTDIAIARNNISAAKSGANTDITTLGQLSLVNFSIATANPPTFNTRSLGTRVVIYPNIGTSNADYAIGVESNNLWYSVPTATQGFKWYAGTTLIANLLGTGQLNLSTVRASKYQLNYNSSSHNYNSNTLDSFENAALLDRGDKLRWQAPVRAEYFDDTTSSWVTWSNPPDFRIITNGRNNGINIDFIHRKFRLIYTGLSNSRCPYFVIEQAFSEKSFTFSVETSSDDVTYTASSIPTSSFTTSISSYIVRSDVGFNANNFARITFDFSSGITASNVSAILVNLKLISYRPADQAPGWQSLFPFDWDQNKNISLSENLSVAGTTKSSGLVLSTKTLTANYTLTATDYTVNGNASTAAITFTLPLGSTLQAGQVFCFAKVDSSANAVTIAAASGNTIIGQATRVLSAQWQSVVLQWDGTSNWIIY